MRDYCDCHGVVRALGYFKNPQSHRKVDLSAWEAREMLVIASHLFRNVEAGTFARERGMLN